MTVFKLRLQLEEAGELLSEEELWYILCEMAQVRQKCSELIVLLLSS